MKIKNIMYLFFLVASLSACQEQDPDVKDAATFPVSGEWYVNEYYQDGGHAGPYHVQIFNTAMSKDSVWVSNIYDDGIVVKTKVSSSKFDIEDGLDVHSGYGKVTIKNSKIVKTDSIYFEVTLYDGEEVYDEFYIAGKRWTGLEDH